MKLQSVDTPCIIRTTIVSLQNFLIGSNSLNTETTHIHLIKTCGKYYYSNCPTLIKPFLSYIVQVFTPLQVHLRFLFFSIFCCRKAYNLVRSQTCATFISIFLEVFTLKIRVHIIFFFSYFHLKLQLQSRFNSLFRFVQIKEFEDISCPRTPPPSCPLST